MPLSIATWNINSVRLRSGLVEKLLTEHEPDILCLQEIKCMNDQFPAKVFNKLGYVYQAVHGQKGYHGVATVSKRPLSEINSVDYVSMGDTRHIATCFTAGGKMINLHNFYVPAGGDEPDPAINDKFAHKLDFVDEMTGWFKSHYDAQTPLIAVGDFNIAPYEHDVWSHKQLLNVVSHTPVEVEKLNRMKASLDWTDSSRAFVPEEEKCYTWWSYRNRDWKKSNRGRRLDHIWVTPPLKDKLINHKILREARDWDKPSDHVPLMVELEP